MSSVGTDGTSKSNATSGDTESSSAVRTPLSGALPDPTPISVAVEGGETETASIAASISTDETRKPTPPLEPPPVSRRQPRPVQVKASSGGTITRPRGFSGVKSPYPSSAPAFSNIAGLGITNFELQPISSTEMGWVSSRAQARELVEAQRRAIEMEHEQLRARKRAASASSDHPSIGKTMPPAALPVEEEAVEAQVSSMTLRERLAALGQTVQIERRFARGEKQGQNWHSPADDESNEGHQPLEGTLGITGPLGSRNRQESLDKVPDSDIEGRKSSQLKRDVFGRPISASMLLPLRFDSLT